MKERICDDSLDMTALAAKIAEMSDEEFEEYLNEKETIVEYKGYVAVQTVNHHVHISKDGRTLMHASVDHRLTDEELRQMIDLYLQAKNHPEELDALPDVEEIYTC